VTTFQSYLQKKSQQLEIEMEKYLPKNTCPLYQAMHYVCFNGGKRLRPILTYATAEALSKNSSNLVDTAACAIELIHCYSLVHDDLPAMDNDDIRRGKPTCHIAFGEAEAILVGDALQTLAFEILSQDSSDADKRLQLIHCLSNASGNKGMVLGQSIDTSSHENFLFDDLKYMHRLKTGCLIKAAVKFGVIASGFHEADISKKLESYAEHLGLAFQIYDDLLDETTDTKTLGKPSLSDRKNNKNTYVSFLGLSGAEQFAKEEAQQAIAALEGLSLKNNYLIDIANYSITRTF